MTLRSNRQGRDVLQLYAEWFGEVEHKALSARGRNADRDRRQLAITAFVLAVMLAPAPEERTT